MNIIDNIPISLDNYGIRWQLTYSSQIDVLVDLRIMQRNFTGVIKKLKAATSDIGVSFSFADGDVFRPISGTSYQLMLYDETGVDFADIQQGSDSEFYIELRENNVLIGAGYILPETYQSDFGDLPDVVTITASDNLGKLKDVKFEHNDGSKIVGLQRVSDVISFILSKCLLRGNWFDYMNLRPEPCESEWRGLFVNLHIECDKYVDKMCEEVLVNILTSFNAQIVRYQDDFVIQSVTDVERKHGVMFTRRGEVAATGTSVGLLYDLDEQATLVGRMTKSTERSVQKVEIEYINEYNDNLLEGKRPQPIGYLEGLIIQDNLVSMPPTTVPLPPDFLAGVEIYFARALPLTSCYLKFSFLYRLRSLSVPPDGTIKMRVAIKTWNFGQPENIQIHVIPLDVKSGWSEISQTVRISQSAGFATICFVTPFERFLMGGTELGKVIRLDIHNWALAVVDNLGEFQYENHIETLTINDDNKSTIEVSKVYHQFDKTRPHQYVWRNSIFTLGVGGLVPIHRFVNYTNPNFPITLHGYIKDKYVNFYQLNKLRVTAVDFIDKSGFLSRLYPCATVTYSYFIQDMKISSCTYMPRTGRFSCELIGFRQKEWILEHGKWNDKGVWIDSKKWKD